MAGRYRNKSAITKDGAVLDGVADGARTHDNRNHNPGLYQLSYSHRKSVIITLLLAYSRADCGSFAGGAGRCTFI